MISARDFIKKYETQVDQEVTDILQDISEELSSSGSASGEWEVRHIPMSLAALTAQLVSNELEKMGWECNYEVRELSEAIEFNVYLSVRNLV
ncbi:hypothetical protein DET48_14721 [Vibrio diazotrophicus]|uniref:Uncharacterized protein n=1 Tax=Vibrio diazotrophicus TaxID=685 RepID=A0A329DWX6_VIBDI|nr:hypothetical protein [Vibrio diazotrophicus]RAS55270.1 hypothetical protein DET48_14721 [Vibrio diazotrophicus]